jgi:hypothetical protein
LLIEAYSGAGLAGRPGLILFVQTLGDLATFNLHIHVVAADRVLRTDSAFAVVPAIPVKFPEKGFRSQVLKLLVAESAIGARLAASMFVWRYSRFSGHNGVRFCACDAEVRRKLV